MVRLINFRFLIIGLLFAFTYANFDFVGREYTTANQVIGQVLYKDKVVINFYSPGPFVTEYSRAQMTAYRLNEYIQTYADLNKIKLSYPEKIYTASIEGRNLFSVYGNDIKQRNTTVERVMAGWIGNIKLAMMPKKAPVVELQVTTSATVKPIEKVEPVPAPVPVQAVVATEQVVSTKDAGFVRDLFLNDIEERMSKVETKLVKPMGKKSGISWVLVFVMLNIGISIYLFFMLRKALKQLGNYEDIEKTGRLEELENSVSSLIKELTDVSKDVADKTIKNVADKKEAKVEPVTEPATEFKLELEPDPVVEEIVEEDDGDLSDLLPDITDVDIVPEVETKIDMKFGGQSELDELMMGADAETSLADTLEEALIGEPASEVIATEDLMDLAYDVVQPTEEANQEKTDAEKLAEELDGGSPVTEAETAINNPNQSNLSGLGMAELFKILSQLDKELRDSVQNILNNKSYNKNERIIKMQQLEMDIELIAKVLGIGKEEVALVIQLNDLEA